MVVIIEVHRTAGAFKGSDRVGAEGGWVQVIKNVIYRMILESDIQQIAEICGSAIRPDCLDGGAVKTFVEPVIIVVFRYRRTGDHGIVVKVFQRACALVFLVCQNCLQSRQGLVILIKGIKCHNQKDTQ